MLCMDNDVTALCVPKMNISDKLPLQRPMTRWRNELQKDTKNRLGDRYNTSVYSGRQKWRFQLKENALMKT